MGAAIGATSMFGGMATPPSTLPPAPAQTASWSVPSDFQIQQWFGSTTMEMQALMPTLSQQASMIPNCNQSAPIMLDSTSTNNQQVPIAPLACQQVPELSASNHQAVKTPGS